MVPKLPAQVVTMMASREMRMHHYLWHQVRNGFLFFDQGTQKAIRDMGWEPPRPAQRPRADGSVETILDNDSGEDFLYMHRQMIASVNAVLDTAKDPQYPKVQGWTAIPRPGDGDYPVPPAYASGDDSLDSYLRNVKSDDAFSSQFVEWESDYTNPDNLASMTLAELGSRLEFTVHNQMHMRWSSPPVPGVRPDVDADKPGTIDASWDDAQYDWLGDTYSSHVNPVFWKLHGWVDDRIEDWKRANHIGGDIAWKGTWTGKPAADGSFDMMDMGHGMLDELEHLVGLVARSGHICHFYDDVSLSRTRRAGG